MSNTVPKTPGLVTIRYVVMSILNRLQDYSLKQYKRLCQIAIEGYTEELSTYHLATNVEVVYLHMSTAKTVDMPADRKSTRLNSSHSGESRMPSSA